MQNLNGNLVIQFPSKLQLDKVYQVQVTMLTQCSCSRPSSAPAVEMQQPVIALLRNQEQ